MDWIKAIVASLISTSAVAAAIFFIARESFKGMLSKRLESFKHDLGLDATRRELALRSQIEFSERQLSEFYGPIYALLKRIRPIDDMREGGKLRDIDDAAIKVIRESNDRIVEIILTKSHLIRGDKIPESFTRYLLHVAVWHAFLNTAHRGFPDAKEIDVSAAYYVEDFEVEVFQTTESLKRELFELYQRYGLADTNKERLRATGAA